jgi:hypothetical protein
MGRPSRITHLLSHTYCTQFGARHSNLTLQRLMGHSQPKVTHRWLMASGLSGNLDDEPGDVA